MQRPKHTIQPRSLLAADLDDLDVASINDLTLRRAIKIRVDEIRPDPNQVRREFDSARERAMTESLRQHGLLSPIIVRPDDEARGYILVGGERRWRSAKALGWPVIDAFLRSDKNVTLIAIIDNMQREELNPVEQADALRLLMEQEGFTQDEAGRAAGGLHQVEVARLLALHRLPAPVLDEYRRLYRELDISHTAMAELATLDNAKVLDLWPRLRDGELSVSALRAFKKELRAKAATATPTAMPLRLDDRIGKVIRRAIADTERRLLTIAKHRAALGSDDREALVRLKTRVEELLASTPVSPT